MSGSQARKASQQLSSPRSAAVSAAMAPASCTQVSEKPPKWQFADSAAYSEPGSQQDGSSQSPEDALEVQEKTDELFWRSELAEFF